MVICDEKIVKTQTKGDTQMIRVDKPFIQFLTQNLKYFLI